MRPASLSRMTDLLTRLSDSTSTEARLAQAAATGLLTVVMSPARMPKSVRTATHVGSAVVGAAAGAYAFPGATVQKRAAATVGFGALLAGCSVLGLAIDRGAEDWLRQRGVRRPRVLFGVVAAGYAWVTSGPDAAKDAVVPQEASSAA